MPLPLTFSASATAGLYALPVLTAVVFSWIGWIYMAAGRRRIPATALYVYLGLVGTVVFGWRTAGTAWREAPAAVWMWGAAAGISQCLLIWGVKAAMERGPMSPLWCAMNLSFAPVILVSAAGLGEPLTLAGAGAVAAGVATVALGSIRQASETTTTTSTKSAVNAPQVVSTAPPANPNTLEPFGASSGAVSSPPNPSAAHSDTPSRRGVYALLLLGVLASNSVMNIGIKVLGDTADASGTATWMDRFGPLFFFLLYACILMLMGLAFGVRAPGVILARRCGALGIGAGLCSVAGLWMLGAAASLPAVYVFTVSCVVNILLTTAVSVVGFGEKTDRVWAAMMACAVAAVMLAGLGSG